jgi:hypothetical protein
VQHDKVTVLRRLDIHAGAITAGELLVIEIDANGGGIVGLDGGAGERQQQQREYHGRLLLSLLIYPGCATVGKSAE